MIDLENVTSSAMNMAGGSIDPSSAEGQNVLAFAQNAAFNAAGTA